MVAIMAMKPINDLEKGATKEKVEGKWKQRRYYITWKSMWKRCTDRESYPNYKGCSVAPEWQYLSNFKRWYEKREGKCSKGHPLALDKDLFDAKVYSEETCAMLPVQLNNRLINSKNKIKSGVSYIKVYDSYVAKVLDENGNRVNSPYYKDADSAHEWYLNRSEEIILTLARAYYLDGSIDRRVLTQFEKRFGGNDPRPPHHNPPIVDSTQLWYNQP